MSAIREEDMDLGYAEDLSKEGIDVLACFQCKSCSASCPMSYWEGPQIRKFVRKVNLGIRNEVEEDESLWQCVNCYACASYCPRALKPTQLTRRLRNEQTHGILNKIESGSDSTKVFICRELQEEYKIDSSDWKNIEIIDTFCASNITSDLLLQCIERGPFPILILTCDSNYKCKHGDGRFVGANQVGLTTSMLEEWGIEFPSIECRQVGGSGDIKSALDEFM